MTAEIPDQDYQRYWRRLQQLGVNAYEARSYLVLLGHSQFKALELASRAHVPRQKIYEVLDSLVEKGFAHMVQERTKLFSAVPPDLAIPGYIQRRRQAFEQELIEQSEAGAGLIEELKNVYAGGQEARGTLDFLRIVNDPGQAASEFRRMLADAKSEYVEFLRPPYAADPFQESLIGEVAARGLRCRFLVESGSLTAEQRFALRIHQAAGIEVRLAESLPIKLALFDLNEGLIALLDPVVSKPTWTTVAFTHEGMAEAMSVLFEQRWMAGELLTGG